jgi:uncharacterized protein YbjT (DUF2867 family)
MSPSRDDYTAPAFETSSDTAIAVAEQPDALRERRAKPVVVTGASGLVGCHLCALLTQGGWKVRGIVRDTGKAAARLGHLELEIRAGDIRDRAFVESVLEGAGSLVHLAAIAIEKSGESYSATNTDATRIILDAMQAKSVQRLVYMSQNGADSRAPYPFLRSKGAAQDMVTGSTTHWTVLKPSVIFGPEDEFVNVLARLVRLTPVIFPLPGGGTSRFQPIAVDDVARAIVKSLEDDATIGRSYSLGGPTPLTLRQMTERILIAMSTSRMLVGVPVAAIRPLVALAQRALPNPPVTTGLLDLLDMDNVVERNDLSAELGISPVPFAPEELLYLKKITAGSALKSLFRS